VLPQLTRYKQAMGRVVPERGRKSANQRLKLTFQQSTT